MQRQGLTEPARVPHAGSSVVASIYALYWQNTFLGSCFAIAPEIVLSAGHHYNASKDEVGDFSVLVGGAKWVRVSYAAKDASHDVLVLWLAGALENFTTLRGYLPPINANVTTVWLSPKPPHDAVISPGVVVESGEANCTARGTVSTTGSSGAPVIDFYGTCVVGLHLTSNTQAGSRVSGFLPARRLVSVLAEMGVSCRLTALADTMQ